ncbi:helix-turn-helix transcriptional regulator [Marinactinospora endophytica]
MGWESGKIIRLEGGKFIRVNSADIDALCRLYEASDDLRTELVEIAKAARQHKPWWFNYKDVAGAFYGLENEARKIEEFGQGIVPGLYQHPDYIKALMGRGFVTDRGERRRRIEVRLERQRNVLERDEPPQLWTVIDESALRCQIGGPSVMAEQLRRLVDLIDDQRAGLQVLPFARGMSQNYSFSLFTFSDNDRVVFVDIPPAGLFFEGDTELTEHDHSFDHLQAAALSVAESRQFIASLVTEYERAA